MGIPVIVTPVQVQVALGIIPVQNRNVDIAVNLRGRTETDDGKLELLFGVSRPRSEQMLDFG